MEYGTDAIMDDYVNQDDYFRSQGLVLNADGTEWIKPVQTWVDQTPIPLQNPDTSPADIAAYKTARAVNRKEKLPVQDDRGHPFGPLNPEAPGYLVEPDLQETQGGMHLPQNMYQDAGGGIFFNGTNEPVPVAKRPGLLPVTMTPEGLKFVMPKVVDLVGNVMGNVGGKVMAKPNEMVLGSGMVKTTPEALKQAEPFYSALERAVASAKVDKATPEQWLGYLRNQPGVKAEELNYVLKDLGEGQISRKYLEDVVKENKVELKEKVLGITSFDNAISQARASGDTEAARLLERAKSLETVKQRGTGGVSNSTMNFINEARQPGANFPLPEGDKGEFLSFEAVNRARNYAKAYSDTKYHSYQLPGGENYKEMLLRLPEQMVPNGRFVVTDGTPTFNMAANTKSEAQEIINNMQKHSNKPLSIVEDKMPSIENFKSSHWDEPNILAHIRHNDRFIPDETGTSLSKLNHTQYKGYSSFEHGEGPLGGPALYGVKPNGEKTIIRQNFKNTTEAKNEADQLNKDVAVSTKGIKSLHIEEIQSDWHQKGRKEGYKITPQQKKELETIDEKLMKGLFEKEIGSPDMEAVLKTAVDKKVLTAEEAKNYRDYSKGENSTVPDAPFKRNWDELALKRMIRKAADEGYDAISWTPGEAQAARYDLSKKVEKIHWDPQHETVGKDSIVRIYPKDADPINLQYDNKGTVIASFPASQTGQFEGKNLSDVIGKEIAEKILNKKKGSLEGLDLKIGGEGMKTFYDKMLVDRANNLIKKYGSKVEQREIPVGPQYKSLAYFLDWAEAQYPAKYSRSQLGEFWKHGEQIPIVKEFVNSNRKQPIHYFPITPALREKATKEGFPLFSSGNPTLIPIDNSPEFEDKKKIKLIPVSEPPEF